MTSGQVSPDASGVITPVSFAIVGSHLNSQEKYILEKQSVNKVYKYVPQYVDDTMVNIGPVGKQEKLARFIKEFE